MFYAITQYSVLTKTPTVIFVSQDINAVRDFCKYHVNNLITIKNESIDDDFLKVKACYESCNRKLVIFKNIKEIKPGYIYNSEVVIRQELYYYTISFISNKVSRLIRLTTTNSFNNTTINEFVKINCSDTKNLHKQLLDELKEVFDKKGLNTIEEEIIETTNVSEDVVNDIQLETITNTNKEPIIEVKISPFVLGSNKEIVEKPIVEKQIVEKPIIETPIVVKPIEVFK